MHVRFGGRAGETHRREPTGRFGPTLLAAGACLSRGWVIAASSIVPVNRTVAGSLNGHRPPFRSMPAPAFRRRADWCAAIPQRGRCGQVSNTPGEMCTRMKGCVADAPVLHSRPVRAVRGP